MPLVGYADETDRIEEILHRKNFSPSGHLLSEVRASIKGCSIRVHLEKRLFCAGDQGFTSHTDYIDLRTLVTNKDTVKFKDFSGTRLEAMKGSAKYQYRSLYNRFLRLANKQKSRILYDQDDDLTTRAEADLILSKRYRDEIDPQFYSRSFETTLRCSGVEIKQPLSSDFYSFYLEASDMDEFATLIERLSQTCDADLNG